jgi:hypothetical protein
MTPHTSRHACRDRGIVGPMVIGFVVGATSFVLSLMLGTGFWPALAAYMAGGSMGVLGGGIAMMMTDRNDEENVDVSELCAREKGSAGAIWPTRFRSPRRLLVLEAVTLETESSGKGGEVPLRG